MFISARQTRTNACRENSTSVYFWRFCDGYPTPGTGKRRESRDNQSTDGLCSVVIAAAQLMVVLDGTITNIALPSIQKDLHVSASNLAWIVNSYALAFWGLLLLGGKLATSTDAAGSFASELRFSYSPPLSADSPTAKGG